MPGIAEIIFWGGIFIIFYTYVGYPLIVYLIILFRKKVIRPHPEYLPTVTLLIAAYNEEHFIEKKIQNSLDLDYPADKMTIVIISDGSTDNTNSIVERYPQIDLLFQPERRGKLAALNRAMGAVRTDLVVMSDANTILNQQCIRHLVTHFADPATAGVAGEKKIITTGNAVGDGEGLYWKYESFLKKLDSDLHTTVGAAGELFCMRTAEYRRLPENIIIEDFVQSLLLCERGFRVHYEPKSFSIESASFSIKDEMERKIRISAGGFQAIIYLRKLLNPFRQPLTSFQYFSHRVLRWTLCPLALLAIFLTNIYLAATAPLYAILLVLQIAWYLAAAAGWVNAVRNSKTGWLFLPFYFTFMNICVIAGLRRFLLKQQTAVWRKASRDKI